MESFRPQHLLLGASLQDHVRNSRTVIKAAGNAIIPSFDDLELPLP
jgi:hypothetical protein